jgi:hypothetical protein
MKISDFLSETKKLKITYKVLDGDITVDIEYRPQAVTVPLMKALEQAHGYELVTEQVIAIVKRWDLQRDDLSEIPITKEALEAEQIPLYLLSSILDAIRVDIAGDREAKNA